MEGWPGIYQKFWEGNELVKETGNFGDTYSLTFCFPKLKFVM
jgi:hypothetical protein